MFRIAMITATLALMSSTSFAGFTVYQGRSGHVLGTCATLIECEAILDEHQGFGESIVDNTTGEEVNAPGRSEFGHAQGNNNQANNGQGNNGQGNNGQGNHGQGNNGRGH